MVEAGGVGLVTLGILGCRQSRLVFASVSVSDSGGGIGSDTRLPRSGSAMAGDGKHGSWSREVLGRGGKVDVGEGACFWEPSVLNLFRALRRQQLGKWAGW